MEPTEPLPRIRCGSGKPQSTCAYVLACVCLRVFSPARPPHLFAVSGRAWQFLIRVTVNVHILSTDVAVTSPADPTL